MIKKNKTALSSSKLKDEIINLKKSLLNLNFQKSTGQLEKTSEIKKTRRKIAQLKTSILATNGEKNA